MEEKKELKSIAIIPARFASTRFPGKLLADLNGKPVLQWVWEAACRSRVLQRAIIATDNEKIAELCFDIGAEFVMTPPDIPCGTDRVFSAYNQIEEDADIILNIQGDEPLISENIIDTLINNFIISDQDVGTLVKKIDNLEEVNNPSVVKVILNNNNSSIYFSRSPIPFVRDLGVSDWVNTYNFRKHIGLYVYKKDALFKFVKLEQTELEKAESLEQLRLIENGFSIFCLETKEDLIGVDTPEDLEKAKEVLLQRFK